jgi:hypothetical protein
MRSIRRLLVLTGEIDPSLAALSAHRRSAMERRTHFALHASRRPRRAALVALAVAGLTLGLAGPTQATITPSSSALAIAQAIASSSVTVTGASFVAKPPSGTPNGVSTSALGGFPVDGAS